MKLLHFCNPLEVVELVADFLWAALPQSKASQRKQYETVVGSLSKILRSILAATRCNINQPFCLPSSLLQRKQIAGRIKASGFLMA